MDLFKRFGEVIPQPSKKAKNELQGLNEKADGKVSKSKSKKARKSIFKKDEEA